MQSTPAALRRAAAAVLTAMLLLTTAALPANAQIPGLPFEDLPEAPSGVIGEILAPLEDVVGQITEPLEMLGELPLENTVRLTATDAVEASIALSRITFETADLALIGRDDVFADSLSSVAAQGITGAPLLLTPSDTLDSRIAEELTRLGTSEVILLGSDSAITPALEADFVEQFGPDNVTRVGGPSRVETAALLAEEIAPNATHALLMRAYPDGGNDQAQAYADSMASGPLGSVMELPALLTTTDYLHPAAREYLESARVDTVTIVGGEAAVGEPVATELEALGITVERVAGSNRWGTAIEVARYMGFLDIADTSRAILTEGGSIEEPLWSAGFAAAAQGAVFEAPVILADGPLLPPETLAYIGDGLISNALRLSNLPLICNSWVDFIACEAAGLLMLGALDEVNALTGGALEQVLGPVFGPLSEALEGILPASDGTSPGLVGQVLSLIGVGGTQEDTAATCDADGVDNNGDGDIDEEGEQCPEGSGETDPTALFNTAMAAQPADVQDAFNELMGPADARISTSRQAALLAIFTDLNRTLGAPVDTSDPARAAALVEILESIDEVLDDQSGELPTGALDSLLTSVEALLGDLIDGSVLAGLGDVVAGLGIDSPEAVSDLVDDVSGLLGGSVFSSSSDLVDTYGPQAAGLQATVERLTS